MTILAVLFLLFVAAAALAIWIILKLVRVLNKTEAELDARASERQLPGQ